MKSHFFGRRPCPAFTLTEVVLAIGISTVAVVTTAGLLVVATDTQKRAADETYAVQIASNELERIGAITDVSRFPTVVGPLYYDGAMGALPSKTADAVYEITVQASPAPAAPDLPQARIFNAEVRFPAGSSAPENLRFTKLIPVPAP